MCLDKRTEDSQLVDYQAQTQSLHWAPQMTYMKLQAIVPRNLYYYLHEQHHFGTCKGRSTNSCWQLAMLQCDKRIHKACLSWITLPVVLVV